MIKSITLRVSFVFLAGIAFPLISGIITCENYSVIELLGSLLYFFFIALIISAGCIWIVNRVRRVFTINSNPYLKIGYYAGATLVFITLITSVLLFGWLNISKENFSWPQLLKAASVSALLAMVYVFAYEIMILSRERVLDTKIVDQLDKERAEAELSALSNELDPHFMFNSLTTLSHLISTDVGSAYLFNQKLAQVYKYILLNKNREMISLQNEIEFIEDYVFLLKLRHDDKLQLDLRFDRTDNHRNMVLPCALQVLVENAIKHNEFSKKEPLQIRIQLNGSYIKVMNNVSPKLHATSTKVGLRNLSNRYKLICNKDIIIEHHKNYFIVKLPLITQ
jgi:LytS/YehU family sensor histidine kinase